MSIALSAALAHSFETLIAFHGRLEDFVYCKRPYHLQDLIADLIEQSARMLKDDGRLVFFLPTVNEKAAKTAIPNHPDMQLCASTTQHYVNWSRIVRMNLSLSFACGWVAYDSETACDHAQAAAR